MNILDNDPDLGWRPELPWQPQSLPSARRRRELQRAERQNISDGKPSHNGLHLNRKDLEWLIVRNHGPVKWGDNRCGHPGLDLRGADLSGSDMSRLPLADTMLQDSILADANLSGSDLRWVLLNRAYISNADLRGADLFKAHFDSAYLRNSDFRTANLKNAWFNDGTYLDGARLDGAFLSGCHWREVDIVHVKWEEVRTIGEEIDARQRPTSTKGSTYAEAADAYGRLSQLLRTQGKLPDASRFYYRSNVMRRCADWYDLIIAVKTRNWSRLGAILPRLSWRLAIEAVAGYGEYPARVLLWALTSTLIFTWLYMMFGSTNGHPFGFISALVFSLSSLMGRGYALVLPFAHLPELSSLLSVIEGAVGLTLEILFVTTFTRRLIGGT